MGGSARGGDEGTAIATDAAGAAYTTGRFHGTADFNPGGGTSSLTAKGAASPDRLVNELGLQDTFISKLDAGGNFVWAAQVGGDDANSLFDMGEGISVDSAGNVYTTGAFNGSGDFDPAGGAWRLSSGGGVGLFLLKLPQATAATASAAALSHSAATSGVTEPEPTDLLGEGPDPKSILMSKHHSLRPMP